MYLDSGKPLRTQRAILTNTIYHLIYKSGLVRAGRQFWANSLTILNYHRIVDINEPNFNTFKPNVSANPEAFLKQMEYISKWFRVISLRELVDWLSGGKPLPHYAALITFDDGYLDNYTNAFPVLQNFNFPAVIFLTTGHIETNRPFYWDLVAYCFLRTEKDHVVFPNGREQSWDDSDREQIIKSWIETIKVLPEKEKQDWVLRLQNQLDVSVPSSYFQNLMVNWNQVIEMHRDGIEFGGHTVTHPILTRIPMHLAKKEIEQSKFEIEEKLGQKIYGFAYPNGMTNDFNKDIQKAVAEAGYKTAFTLLNGPNFLREVKNDPYTIRRIFISYKHTLQKFAALLSPINRYRP